MLSLDVFPLKVTPLRDHHHHPSVLMLYPQSPSYHPFPLFALLDHPQQHIIQYLITCLTG